MLHERHLRPQAPEVWSLTPVKSFKDNVKFCFTCDCGISLIIFDELNDVRTKLQALTLRQIILTVLKRKNTQESILTNFSLEDSYQYLGMDLQK